MPTILTDKHAAISSLRQHGYALVDSERLAAAVVAAYPHACDIVPLSEDDTLAAYGSGVSKVLIETYVLQDVRRLLRDEREHAGVAPFGEPLI